jgi:hypothetical protein
LKYTLQIISYVESCLKFVYHFPELYTFYVSNKSLKHIKILFCNYGIYKQNEKKFPYFRLPSFQLFDFFEAAFE